MLNPLAASLFVNEDIRRHTPGKGKGGLHPTRLLATKVNIPVRYLRSYGGNQFHSRLL